ncbi:MAG: histidine kinase dimerization/phosphoacceptor domain -containing protein, partial [Myxococcota bacterium]
SSSILELDDPTLTKNEVEKCKQLAQSEEADEELGLDAKRVEADYLDRQGRHEAAFDVMDTLHDELSTFYETMGKQQLRLAVAELEGALNRQDVLLAEERAASAELQAERQRVWLLLAGSGSLLLVGLTVLAVVIARQRSQTSEQLRLTAESLEERGRELHHAVKEKEVLLQELNHRVKNNLQVVASLLGLERRRAESVGADFSGMKEVQARVLSMASVHEGIQELGAFDRVDLAAYLRRLSDRLGLVHGAKGQVEPAVSCEPRIDMSAAAPIGLICCELVSNAYEHAYAEGGSVVIALTRDGDGAVLKVSDEGRGLPGDFSLASLDSLGLSLVQDLARQVGTRISWEENSPQGVTWTLPIPGHRLAWG